MAALTVASSASLELRKQSGVSLDFDLALRLATALLSLSAKDELGSGSSFCLACSRAGGLLFVTVFVFVLEQARDQLLQAQQGQPCPLV